MLVDTNVNADAVEMLQTYLESRGHEVMVAHQPALALVIGRQFRPHVVIIDIGLPGIDGIDVARILRGSFGATLRLVVVSAFDVHTYDTDVRTVGIAVWLRKPIDFALLDAAVMRV